MDRTPYPSDPTDERWALLAPLLPPARPGSRPRSVDPRDVANATLYLLRTGFPWRSLPHDLPPRGTGSGRPFRRWRDDGALDRLHDALPDRGRGAAVRDRLPSAPIPDGLSVETAGKGGRAAPTPARRFRGASAASSAIPRD